MNPIILVILYSHYFSGTDDERAKIRIAAEQLDDSAGVSRIHAYSNIFKYHQKPKASYSTYILKFKKSAKTKSDQEVVEEVEEGASSDTYKAPKMHKKSVFCFQWQRH